MRARQLRLLCPLCLLLPLACSSKPSEPACGDGVRAGEEVCDGGDVGQQSCEGLGFGPGALGCKSSCQDYDRSGCGAPSTCGNGAVDGPEVCDGAELGGKRCEDLGLGAGTLSCKPNCSELDTSRCGPPPGCGDGVRAGPELCDGSDLGGQSCESLKKPGGTLACAKDCLSFDTSGCGTACTPECGTRKCGVDPVCGKPCGTCDAKSVCDDASGQCVAICDLDPLTSDGVLDLDLKTVSISGTVTLGGKPLPDNSSNNVRAYLRFVNSSTGDYVSVPLGATGPATYSTTLPAGTYELVLAPQDAQYQTVLPPLNHQVQQGLVLQTSGVKDVDLKTVKVSGTVTVNGQPMAGNSSSNVRAYLRFVDGGGSDTLSVPLGATGAATYSTTLWAGTYDLVLAPQDAQYQTVLPALNHLAQKGLALQVDGVKDVDLKTVKVSGAVTVNGQPMAGNSSSNIRAYLRFVDGTVGDTLSVGLGASGAATYSTTLWAGTYDLVLAPQDAQYQSVLPPLSHLVQKGLALQVDGVKDLDLKTVKVSGVVTLNGQPMPANSNSNPRAYLRFVDPVVGDTLSLSLNSSGAASYSTTLWASTYDLLVAPQDAQYQTVLPPLSHLVQKGLALQVNGVKDLDLKTVKVSGVVTLNGQPMPANSSSNPRAYLRFFDASAGDTLSVSLGATGPAAYTTTIFAGTYDLLVAPQDAQYQTVLPALKVAAQKGLALQVDGVKDLDLKTVKLSGQVTLNGQPMPSNGSSSSRASLRFLSPAVGDTLSVALGASGAASYSTVLFAGTFDVLLAPQDAQYQSVLPAVDVRLRRGCLAVGACTGTKADVTGVWQLLASSSTWGSYTLTLQQSGSSFTGSSYSNTWGYPGSITSGSKSGDSLTFTLQQSNFTAQGSATLQSGCLMSGSFSCPACAPSFTSWTAFRTN